MTMVRQMIVPVFEDIKDLIKSTVKATETVLRKDITTEISKVSDELKLTQSALKATKEDLECKIDSMGKDLRGEIKDSEIRLTERLQGNIKDSEIRLTEKIDSIHIRVDDHETRIIALENPGH